MKRYRSAKPVSEINVVPYIDVMLVLLVIFMITTPLLNQGVSINLPQAEAKAIAPQQQEPVIVSVDAEGQFYLNIAHDPDKPIDAHTLAVRIAAELQLAKATHQKRLFLVKGDRTVAYDKVIQAMVLLQQAGVENIGLMTKPNEYV
ncbi:MAG: protein TolR [Gammaproteobacteria bacterium]